MLCVTHKVSKYPELIVPVFGALVKGAVVVKAAYVVGSVEAFDSLRHAIQVWPFGQLRHWGHCKDLQV